MSLQFTWLSSTKWLVTVLDLLFAENDLWLDLELKEMTCDLTQSGLAGCDLLTTLLLGTKRSTAFTKVCWKMFKTCPLVPDPSKWWNTLLFSSILGLRNTLTTHLQRNCKTRNFSDFVVTLLNSFLFFPAFSSSTRTFGLWFLKFNNLLFLLVCCIL